MNYFILAAMTAFLSMPQLAYEQKGVNFGSPPAISMAESEQITEEAVKEIPEVLRRIAICESQNAHFNEDGKVLRGGYNHHDIGKYQINDLYWGDFAKELGLNIYTEEGNEALALAIYEKYGTAPWNWSKKCWNK